MFFIFIYVYDESFLKVDICTIIYLIKVCIYRHPQADIDTVSCNYITLQTYFVLGKFP